jgi:hypothetical protein
MLDHEAMSWGRSLQPGDKVVLQAASVLPAVVRQLRPWRERTQILLAIGGSADTSSLTTGQPASLRLATPPVPGDRGSLPAGLGKSSNKLDRVEWIVSSMYCTCGMHDECAGHVFTLAACNAGAHKPCGLARSTRERVAQAIDEGQTDWQILEQLLKERGRRTCTREMDIVLFH